MDTRDPVTGHIVIEGEHLSRANRPLPCSSEYVHQRIGCCRDPDCDLRSGMGG
jgi:hypothetical protein